MSERTGLHVLVSQVLVAWTIELDNAFEARVPHRSTHENGRAERSGVWLVSVAMWAHYLRFIEPEGTTVRDFVRRSRLTPAEARRWLARLSTWWSYVEIVPPRSPDERGERGAWIVRATRDGRIAQATWAQLFVEMNERWTRRFGSAVFAAQTAASAIAAATPVADPIFLPLLGYGLRTTVPLREGVVDDEMPAFAFPAALARVAQRFAREFESGSAVPIAVAANVLRVIGAGGTPVRELPAMTGLAKEAVDASIKLLQRDGFAELGDGAPKRAKCVLLTAAGRVTQAASASTIAAIEQRWHTTFGDAAAQLQAALATIVDARAGAASILGDAIAAEAGWRAKPPYRAQLNRIANDPGAALPHFPMVTHRGGYPDGS